MDRDEDRDDYYNFNLTDSEDTDDGSMFDASDESALVLMSDSMEVEDNVMRQVDGFMYEVLSTEEIEADMQQTINEVQEVVQIPNTAAVRNQLNHSKWDVEKALEQHYSDDGREMVFQEAQVPPAFDAPAFYDSRGELECEICGDTQPGAMMTGLECGHLYCSACWTNFLTTKIMDVGDSEMIQCPGDCKAVVDDKFVMKLITESRVKQRYKHLVTDCFVQCNRLLRWCPNPGCNNAIKVQDVEAKQVKCACGNRFCFDCGENHDLVPCSFLKKWNKMFDADGGTSRWMKDNAKPCPAGCRANIEKTGGCDIMACTNRGCNTTFCWICLAITRGHQHIGRCPGPAAPKNTEANQSQRFAFHSWHYANHRRSLKSEERLHEILEKKMEGTPQVEKQFLNKAINILLDCRRTLMYANLLSFNIKANNWSEVFEEKRSGLEIFEENRSGLEIATEKLSAILAGNISAESIMNIVKKIKRRSDNCQIRCKALHGMVREGFAENWWIFHDTD